MPAEALYKQELRRSLRPLDLVLYGIVFMSPIAGFTVFGFVHPRGRSRHHRLPGGHGAHIYGCHRSASL